MLGLRHIVLRTAVALGACACACAGGGGLIQVAPDTILAGVPAKFALVASVWGAGGSIKGRYREVVLHYRLVDESEFQSVLPTRPTRLDNHRERYDFTLPAY